VDSAAWQTAQAAINAPLANHLPRCIEPGSKLVNMDENLFIVAWPFVAPLYPNAPATETFEVGARLIRTGQTPDGLIRFRREEGRTEYVFSSSEFRRHAKNPSLSQNPQ
jgi:hypothetical protein